MRCQTSGSPIRSQPVDREVAVVELHASGQASQLGTCTPLVMWPMGISSSTRQGQRWAHIRRVTWPCRLLTALARRESFRPSTVMQNGLAARCAARRGPGPSVARSEMPNSSRSGPRCSSIRPPSKRSWPAGTGVWVVKTVCWATSRRASSKLRPSLLHPLADRLQRGEDAVPFVQVVHARR